MQSVAICKIIIEFTIFFLRSFAIIYILSSLLDQVAGLIAVMTEEDYADAEEETEEN